MEADPLRLAQVLTNLLNNAAKYTEPRRPHRADSRAATATTVVVRVRDDGIGIAPETAAADLRPVHPGRRSLDRSQGGLGIGLALVKQPGRDARRQRARAQQGPGRGSEFIVRLPVLAARPAQAANGDDGPGLGLPPVLAASSSWTTTRTPPRAWPWCCAADGTRGPHRPRRPGRPATAAETFRPEIVFLDIGLPGMDGYDVARRLRQEPALAGLLLVALTGYGQDEDRRRSREAGFDHHLVKPVEPDALQESAGQSRRCRQVIGFRFPSRPPPRRLIITFVLTPNSGR